MGVVPREQPAFRAFAGAVPPRFVNDVELECAKLLDFYGVPWEYEPTTFVLERAPDGRVTRAFTPDFYLPEQDLYVEVTVMRQSLVTRKNRKLRELKLLHPEVIPYGARSSTASISCSSPFSTLNTSAISQVHGCCGPAVTVRPSAVWNVRVFPAGWSKNANASTSPRS